MVKSDIITFVIVHGDAVRVLLRTLSSIRDLLFATLLNILDLLQPMLHGAMDTSVHGGSSETFHLQN